MNLFVNPESGNITGIVNWAESRILPLGFTLYGIEKLLGWMDTGVALLRSPCELESLFWETFQEEVEYFRY